MKKSMESAYTDMMNNLAKSSAAIPLHLQGATGALAWWEQQDSLLAKSDIAPADEALAKASAENETDEAYEEDEKKDAEKKAEKEPEEKEESDEAEESDEDPEPAEEGMKKALAELDAIASAMLAKGDSYLPGQMEMFGDAPPPAKAAKAKKPKTEKQKAPEQAGK